MRNALVLAVVELLFLDIPGITMIYDSRCYILKKDLGFDMNVCTKTHKDSNEFATGVVYCLDIKVCTKTHEFSRATLVGFGSG